MINNQRQCRSLKIDLPKLSRTVWENVNQVKLTIYNAEGDIIKFPAVYGVAACSLFPMVSFWTIYTLAKSKVRMTIEKSF